MIVAHLAESPFFGGPEQQMLGLAQSLPADCRTVFLLLVGGNNKHRPFLEQLRRHGLEAVVLESNWPRARATVREIAGRLAERGAGVLCTHGYKADLLGLPAARRAGVPIVAVLHGWTGETLKVRLNEAVDRFCLRWMDRAVCVSEGQAVKARRAGAAPDRTLVIHDAVRTERFDVVEPSGRSELEGLFPRRPRWIVGAAGRLSPEKGFGVLVEAAAQVVRTDPDVGFVLFGDGFLRPALAQQITARGLDGQFLLAGFRNDLDRFFPHFDLVVLPSFTEGLPNVVLEASAAGVAVVATAVGGTPEAIEDGVTGHLVPPGDPTSLARRILQVLGDNDARRTLGRRGREWVRGQFTFEAQAVRYRTLFESLRTAPGA